MVSDHHDDEHIPGDAPARRDLDVSYLGRRLKAQRRWLLGPALACFAVSAIAVNIIAPRYTAETKVLIGTQEAFYNRLGAADTQQQTPPDDEAVQSQVQLVSSRDLARQAIKALDLKGNPEFDPAANGAGSFTQLLMLFGLARDPLGVPPEERMLPAFSEHLTVFPITKSRVLTIEFDSKDADLSARAANTVADLYLDIQSTAKRDAAHQAAEALHTLVADLRSRSAEADAKAQAFRSQSGLLLGTNNTAISSQQLTDMTTQLAQARSGEADAQAKAKLIRDMVKEGRLAEVPDVANNDLIRKLSEQRAAVQAEVALQSRTLLSGHPRMQELTAQLQSLDAQLRGAAEKVVRGLDSDARIAQARVDNLTTAINGQKDAIGAAGPDQVKLSEFDLTARMLKDQLEFNTSKYQEALARENVGANPADARIISRAVAPQLPSFPKKLPIIAIMTIAGFVLSLGILIARELLSGRAFEMRAPASLPIVLGNAVARTRREDDEDFALRPSLDAGLARGPVDEPGIAAGGAMAALHDDLMSLKQAEQALRAVVCGIGAAGASRDVALQVGRSLSRSARVIAVDLSDSLASPERLGFADLLDGHASFAEVIYRDPTSRLHLIASGAARDKIAGDRDGMANILDALAETYDYVIVGGLAPEDDAADALAGDHADVFVVAAEASLSDSERQAVLAKVGVDDTIPVLSVELQRQGYADPRRGEAA